MAVNPEDVPSLELMTEMLCRMKCSSKPDKRIINSQYTGRKKKVTGPAVTEEGKQCFQFMVN
ncbi:hypothetical protein E2562_001918 [Oryza meyeriana var. granulata]|uniref:Uncharacterized protein n=1 Tax=Oryza meyeriana var. granulata TaxID=110450 RepID=A0A6G1C375_9ORYZ|nr:hypothetical protein E2562_001918 [Oryza meyeriana var. granulata]